LPANVIRQALISDLNYRVAADPDWAIDGQVSDYQAVFSGRVSTVDLLTALGQARARRATPAAVGLIRVLTSMSDGSATSRGWLAALDDDGTPLLVAAARDPLPQIRYEASALILELVGGDGAAGGFAGSSDWRKTLAEMSRLDARPTAVLVETRATVALRQERVLGELGFEVRVVETVLQAEREIAQGGDLRVLVSKLRLADMPPPELVDRVRRRPKGRELPVVFFKDPDASERRIKLTEQETASLRWNDSAHRLTYLLPLPGTQSAYAEVLADVRANRRLPPLTATDRLAYRAIAKEALERGGKPR